LGSLSLPSTFGLWPSGESLRLRCESGDGVILPRRYPLGGVALKVIDPLCAFPELDAHDIAVGRCPAGDVNDWRGFLCGDDGVVGRSWFAAEFW
jgi:hypothetical protein